MKNLIRNLALFWLRYFNGIILHHVATGSFLELICKSLEKSDQYITYHLRPKRTDKIIHNNLFEENKEYNQVAIVMQGPIIIKDDFTFETLAYYKKTFINCPIILSTWQDECKETISKLKNLDIIVIENKKPIYNGESSINLQIISTTAGLEYAKSLSVKYAIKTRTDQRMYAHSLKEYLITLLNLFPITNKLYAQKNRLIACSLNTFSNRLYGISDMFMFGEIGDMLIYWKAELDERVFDNKYRINASRSFRSFSEWNICEVYLCTKFLVKIGRVIDWSLRDSLSVYTDHFLIIDKEHLDLIWPKYSNEEYRRKKYVKENDWREIGFKEWLTLYSNNLINKELEQKLNNSLSD